jgi:hypothetical protein
MTYSFGWWDYADGPQPAMVNRFSKERIVRRGPLDAGIAPADEPWLRFDYVADDLTYPLAVKWAPDLGEIILDHNKSAEIWRRETGAIATAPAFGTYVRVDDLAPDAFWCWPGVMDIYFQRLAESQSERIAPITLYRLGGWSNGPQSFKIIDFCSAYCVQ